MEYRNAKEFRDVLSRYLPEGMASRITGAICSGSSCRYRDSEGKEYLDFTSGIFTNIFGHGDGDLVNALCGAYSKLANIHGRNWVGEPEIYEKLFDFLPSGDYRVVPYGDGGAYAVDRAEIELYYHFGGKPYRMVSFDGGFHGKTQGANLTINRTMDSPFFRSRPVPPPNCYRCPCGKDRSDCSMECADLVEKEIEDFGAQVFFFEPILGSFIIIPPEGFWKRLEAFCRKKGVLTVADEVLTGCARTGEFLASTAFGIEPDIILMSKGLANGLPLSLLIMKKELTENGHALTELNYSSTYMGIPALLAVMGEVLDKIKRENILENVRERSAQMLTGLSEITKRYPQIGDLRGYGLMAALEFVLPDGEKTPDRQTERAVFKAAERNGLALVETAHVLRLAPPLNVTEAEVSEGLYLLEKSLSEVLG